MDLQYTPEDRHFRQEVADWLRANVPKDPRPPEGMEARAFDCACRRPFFPDLLARRPLESEHGNGRVAQSPMEGEAAAVPVADFDGFHTLPQWCGRRCVRRNCDHQLCGQSED